jgi:PAS domain S-box-containing protein
MRYPARQTRVGTKESGAAVAKTSNSIENFAPVPRGADHIDTTDEVVANILLVDDHPPNLLALEAILRPLGHRLIKIGSGREALKCLAAQQIAVILLDVRMPGLDGFRTADLIRKERPEEPVPIIFLTAADADPADILRGYERGAVDFLMKPFEPEILRSKVAVFVELYKKEQTVRRQAAKLRLKEREALEHRNAARFHQLLDALPICVVVTDCERRPYYWNQSALSYLGVPVEKSNAAALLGSIHPEDFEHLAAEWTTAEHDKRPFELKSRIRRHDGSYRWHLGRGVPQFDDDSILTGWIVTATDIEDQSQALANAETANRFKDEFLAVVSHELRNPLNAITGWVHLLRSGLDETKIRRAVEIIERNVNLQVALIDEILDLSRIVRNKVRLVRRPIDLISTLRSSLTALRPLAEEKGLQIDLKTAEEGLFVNGDPERLQQIISNLLSNAIKFTPRHGRVTIALTRDEDLVILTITDTGIGISREFLPHVFDPFRQAENTTTRQHGGLGLGLAISKRLIELHGGEVRAESSGLNQGASFIVTLPLLPPDFKTRPERTGTAHFEATSLTGLKILIVDDDPDSREILTEILSERGAVVAVASSASDAMAEIAEAPPDVLVSDIAMPGEDGLSLVRRLSQHAAIRDHRIVTIALTGLSAPQHQRLALEAGFEACLYKPLEPARLIEYIVNAVSRAAVS